MSALDVQFQTLQLSDAIFKDVKFYTTGSLLEKVEELLKAGGAERMNYFSDYVTHLICGEDPEETDITDATDLYEIPAVVPRWVYYSAKLNQILPTKPYLYNGQKLFTNLIFCFSGISEDRNTLWAVITYHGGTAQLNLDQTCTHLITTNTNSEKYLKAESLSEQITIVTPDWVFETARYRNFADAELFHPRLIAWPKKPESTTAITGFEEQTQETLEQQETGLQQALLEKLKQRMPWNQPQVSNSEVPPPNVVAPSYASTKLPQPQELNQQRLFNQKTLPFGQQLNFLPTSNQIPRSIVHHTAQGTQQGAPLTAQGGQQLTPEQQAQRIRALEQIQQNRTLQNQLNRIQQQQQQNQFPQNNQQGRSQQNAELLLRTSSLRQLMSPESQQIVQNIQNVQHTAAQLRQNAQNLPKSAQQQILQRQLSQQQLKNQLLNQQLLQGQQNQQQLLQQGQQNQQLLQQGQQNQQLLQQQGQQNQQLLQQGQQSQQLLQQGQQNQQLLQQQGQQNQQLLQQGQQNQQLLQQGQQNQQLLQQGQQNQQLLQQGQQNPQLLQQSQQNQLLQQNQQQGQQMLQQGQQNPQLLQQGQQNQLVQQGQQNQQLLQQGQQSQLLQQGQQNQQILQQGQQNQLLQQGQQNQQLLQQGQPNQQLLQGQQNQLLQQNQQQQSQQQRLMQQNQQQNQQMLQQGQQREQLLQQNQQLLQQQSQQNQQLLQGQQSQQLLKGQAQQLLRSQQQILTSQGQQILQGSQQQVLQTSQAQQLLLQQQNQQQLLQSQQTQQQLLQNQQNQQQLLQNQQNQQQLLQNQQNQQQLLQNQQGQQQLLQNQPGQQQLLQNRQLLQLQSQQNLLQEQQNQQLLQQGQQQLQNQIMQNQQQGNQQQHGQQMIQTSQAGQQLLPGQQQIMQGQQLLQGGAGKQQLLQRQQSVSGEMLVSPQGQQMLQGQQQRLLHSPQQSQLLLRGQQAEILQSPQSQQMLQSPQQSQLLQSPLQESTPGQQQQILSPQMLSQQQILQSPTNNPLLQGQLMQGQAGQPADILQAQQSQQLDLNQRQHLINQQAALRSNLGQQLIQNKLQMQQQQQQQGQQFQTQQFPQTQNFAQNPNQQQQFLQNTSPQLINQQKLNQQQILTQQKQILLNQQGQQFQGGQPGQQRQFIWQQGQGQPQQQQIQRQLVQGGPRVQWVPGQQPGVAPQRQFIQLDAETHKQLQQMTPEERTVFVQKLHKQRQLLYPQGRVGPQNQQRPSHILIRGGVPPEQQMQWIQQQTKQQGVILQQQQQPQTIQQPQNVQQPPAPPNQQQVAPPIPQPTPGLSPIPQPNYDQNQQHMLLRQKQLQLQQLQQQQQQQQAAAQQKKAHEQLGSQQGVVPRPGPLGPQGGAPPPQAPIDPNSDQNPLVVNPKTKTALANMLNTRLQSGGNIGDPGLPEQPSAAGTLRLMTAQHNAALNSTSRPPQDILAMQRGRLISRTNGDMIRAPVPPVGAPGPPAAEPAKLQFSPRTAVPAQHRPGPYYGHNPNLKLPPDQFLLGCIFVVVEVERYLEESNPGWQKKIEKFGGEIEKQYCSRVTHVICETQRHGVVMQALRDFKRCVTLFWLADVLQKKQVLPPWIALHLPTMYWDASPGAKHLISIGGFTELDRDRVKHMIKYIGASMTTYFSKHNTLLVMTKPEGSKFTHAKKWGTPVVSVNWLTDVMLGHFSALNQLEHIKYQNFAEPSNFSFDPTLVPNLMQAWKMPINISQETFEKIKRAAPTALQSVKLKKPKLEMVTDENDNEENINPNAAHRILFSMCPDVEELKKIVRNLGGTVVKSYKDCTHLVMPTLIRTHKLLCCVTIGVHIVPETWIRDSHASGRFLGESQHSFDAKDFNREFDCDFSRILTVKCRDRLFEGRYFYVTPSVRPSKRDIIELIQLCGGVVERIRRSQAQIEATNVNSPYSYVILTHEQDLHLVADLLRNKKDKVRIVCNSELVMSAILRQTFEVEQYAVRIL